MVSRRYVRERVELVLYHAAVVRGVGLLDKRTSRGSAGGYERGKRRGGGGVAAGGHGGAEGSCADDALGAAGDMAGLVGGADGRSWAAETRSPQAGAIIVVGCACTILLSFEELGAEVYGGCLHRLIYVVLELLLDGGLEVGKDIGRGERSERRQQQRSKGGAHC